MTQTTFWDCRVHIYAFFPTTFLEIAVTSSGYGSDWNVYAQNGPERQQKKWPQMYFHAPKYFHECGLCFIKGTLSRYFSIPKCR